MVEKNIRSKQLPPRPSYRTAVYLVISLIGVGAIAAFFFSPLFHISSKPVTNQSIGDTKLDTFSGLYRVGWRGDGAAGNTSVEAVYYYPALITSLNRYAGRSVLQNETLQELQQYKTPPLFPFLITLQHNTTIDQALPVGDHVTLTDETGASYAVDHWQPLAVSDASGTSLSGILWFTPARTAAPKALTMVVSGLSGNAKASRFSWNVSTLSLIQ